MDKLFSKELLKTWHSLKSLNNMVIQYLSIKINTYLNVKQFIYDTKKGHFSLFWVYFIKIYKVVHLSHLLKVKSTNYFCVDSRHIVADNLSQTHTPYQVLSNGTADDVMSVVTAAKQKQYKVVNDLFSMHCLLKVLWLIF